VGVGGAEPEQTRPRSTELGVNETIAGSTSGTLACEVGWRTASKLASAVSVHELCVVLTLSLIITRKVYTLSNIGHTHTNATHTCFTATAMQAALKRSYGFDLVIAVPRDAHNSMCSAEAHGQQCSASDMLTQQQFDDGVAAFAAVNMSLVLYTSVRCYAYRSQWPTRANSNVRSLLTHETIPQMHFNVASALAQNERHASNHVRVFSRFHWPSNPEIHFNVAITSS